MTNFEREPQDAEPHSREATPCEMCEAMCLDAVDGTLTAAEQAVFERHVATCVGCAEQLAEAQRGAAWMEMLKGHTPEPPAALLKNILAATSGAAEKAAAFADGVFSENVPTPQFRNVVPTAGWREKFWNQIELTFGFSPASSHFQPRMAMTAAMAFFSLALTMNMAGIRLADLAPSQIHRTVADVGASASRSFQNLRVVYQVESKLDDLRDMNAAQRDPAPSVVKPEQKAAPQSQQSDAPKQNEKKDAPGNGTSELVVPSADRAGQQQAGQQQNASRADALRMQEGA